MPRSKSRAKRQLPMQTCDFTRSTTLGAHFMRPGDDTRELTGYMFARALLQSDMIAHVSCMLSDRSRTLATDRVCRRSDFMRDFHSNLARKRNLQLNRSENLWNAAKPGDTVVLDAEDILATTLETILEPVARGYVDSVSEWTGFQILPCHWGKPMKFDRPERCGPDMPETLEFVPMPPPGFDHLPLEEAIDFFEKLVAAEEERLRQERQSSPRGIEYWEGIDPFLTPRARPEPPMVPPRFRAADSKLFEAAIIRDDEFRRDHLDRSREFREGQRHVRFPSGTCQMVRIAGVATEPIRRGDPHQPRLTWSPQLQATWARSREPGGGP